MTNDPSDPSRLDEMLIRSYEPLRGPILEQRQAVLAGLARSRVRSSLAPRRTWPRRTAWVAAACLVVAVGILPLLIPSSPTRLYGLETVSRRLCEVSTIRIRGSRYVAGLKAGHPPTRVPIEYLVKRPDKCRLTWLGVSNDRTKVEIRSGINACDGRQQAYTSDADREYSSEPINPIDARLRVEGMAQGYLLSAVMGPPDAPYRKLGREMVHGRQCDVYEARSGQVGEDDVATVEKLWFDPASGYPVRLTRDEIQPDGTVLRETEFDEIEVNAPVDDEVFTLAVPPGYKRVSPEIEKAGAIPPLNTVPTGGGYSDADKTKLEGWHAFRIADNAMLISWRRNAPQPSSDGKLDWLAGIELSQLDGQPPETLRHAWLYQSQSPDVWNWSLVAVAGGQPLEPLTVSMQLKGESSQLTMGWVALRFPDQQLEQILAAALEAALPDKVPRYTLAEIRARANTLAATKKSE